MNPKPTIKEALRKVRDVATVYRIVSFPFRLARTAGIRIPEPIFKHLPFRGEMEVRCPGGRSFSMASYGHQLENELFWRGLIGYEPECIFPWIFFAERARTVLDIGANTGLYSLLAATMSPHSEVHAFEPVERVYRKLRQNCALNPSLNIVAHRWAVGARIGTATLHDPGGDHAYSASLDPTFLGSKPLEQYAVDVVSVDAFVEKQRVAPGLIKIDVEGLEADVLAGMESTLRDYRPVVMMEYLPRSTEKLRGPLEQLLGQDYELYTIGKEGLRRSRLVTNSPESWNVLLVPAGREVPSVA